MFLPFWFILLTITPHSDALNNFDLKFFEDFLQFNHLKFIILTHDLRTSTKIIGQSDMQEFIKKYRVKWQKIPLANKTLEFKIGYSFSISRVGIIFPEIADFQSFSYFFDMLRENKHIFNNTYAWLFHVNQKDINLRVIRNVFSVQNLNIDTDITFAVDHINDSKKLYDIYKICDACGTPIIIEEKGLWSASKGFELNPHFHETFVSRRRNWENISLNVTTTFVEKPKNLTDAEYLENFANNKQLDFMQRKTYHLMRILQIMFNFSFNIKYSDTWDSPTTANKSSVISMLYEHKAEFSICPIRSTMERLRLIGFSPHIHTEPICFILRHPRRIVIRNIFLEPLTPKVWWAILFVIFLTIILLALHIQQEYKRQRQIFLNLERRFDTAILTILAAIFMQGPSPDLFKLTSTRTLIIVTCTFSLIMMQFYSAFIVGSLLSESPHTITNLEALHNSSFEIGMEDIPYNYQLLKHSKYLLARTVYSTRIMKNPSQNILNLTKGAHRVGKGGFAFYVSTLRAYRYLKSIISESVFCELQEIYVDPPIVSYTALTKTSNFREHISQSILLWHMTGITHYNNKHWALPATDCSLTKKKSKEVEVDLEHFLPAIVFLAMSILLALSVLMFEMLFKKFNERRKKKYLSSD